MFGKRTFYQLGGQKNAFQFQPGRLYRSLVGILMGGLLAAACSPTPTPEALPNTPTATASSTATPAPSPTLTPTHTSLPTETATLPPTATPWPPDSGWLFPDSAIVYSPAAIDFDTADYLAQTEGYLRDFQQYLMITKWVTSAELIDLVALENSINPRLMLALLEYQSGCVLGPVSNPEDFDSAIGAGLPNRLDMYGQLVWAVKQISDGYYGWRAGTLTSFSTRNGQLITPPAQTNAGTVALQYFFAQLYDFDGYQNAMNPQTGFGALYAHMFGDPWEAAALVEPLVPADLAQPELTLPFLPGKQWALTGGPHFVFEGNGPLGALDFAPPTEETGCWQSNDWIVAAADGVIVRSGLGLVLQDLDGDGLEQTGWSLMYLHIDDPDRVEAGTVVKAGDFIGHPSCLGGRATGTHVHIARKYNGEWIAADGPIPFVLDGWTAHNGERPYLGSLTRGDAVVTAHEFGSFVSRIGRDDE